MKRVDEVIKKWPGLKMVHGKPRHSQSQGSVERANRDIENLLACWQAENNSTNWAQALNIIQFQKNTKFHSGIGREPYVAMFGRKAAFGLKDFNLPNEVLDNIETEEQLLMAIGSEELSDEDTNTNAEYVTIHDEPVQDLQSLENIPFVVQESSEVDIDETENANEVIEDMNNCSLEACVTCSELLDRPSFCVTCQSPHHKNCLQNSMVCMLCFTKETMEQERRGTKRRQEEQATSMLQKSARRYKQAQVGDSVMVHLPEVDRGTCEFPNVHAVVLTINESGMYKLGIKIGQLKGVYSRNQFEPLPNPLMEVSDINMEVEIPLRTAANKQSQGGGQGFVKCGCTKTCQANNCKCKKANQFCNSRCHKGSNCCLNHE